ncbi:MAG: HDIG domain-containing protein [Clostridiales bacterium]|nr:HDIG domain-containing protein [Clostridiales bacterium]
MKKNKKEKITVKKSSSEFYNILIHGIITVILCAVLVCGAFVALPTKQYTISVGDISSETIKATHDISIEDVAATLKAKQDARDKVPFVYSLDESIATNVVAELNTMLSGIDSIRSAAKSHFNEWVAERKLEDPDNALIYDMYTISDKIGDPIVFNNYFWDTVLSGVNNRFSQAEAKDLIVVSSIYIEELRSGLTRIVTDTMSQSITQEDLYPTKESVTQKINKLVLPSDLKIIAIDTCNDIITYNIIFDAEATEANKLVAENAVEPVMITYKKGQNICEEGQPVTQMQYDIIKDLGLLKETGINFSYYLGISLMVVSICVVHFIALTFFNAKAISSIKNQILVALIVLISSMAYVLTLKLSMYFITSFLCAMLISLTVDNRTAFTASMTVSAITGIYADCNFSVFIASLLGTVICITCLKRTTQRRVVIVSGLAGGLGTTVMLMVLQYYQTAAISQWHLILLYVLLGAFSSCMLSIGLLPILENAFRIITPIRMLELSNPNQAVLKRMLLEAPGTYYHSMVVGNMAEIAANAVGANGLLARIGALYHDVGKLMRPYMFKENQNDDVNPHDDIPPETSAKIITSHVKDGLHIAKKYKVSELAYDFILEHHGTTTASFFYHKAVESYGFENVNIEDYKYSGRIPSSPESAIVMMADTCEAAVRAQKKADPNAIRELINKLIDAKINDRQLDDCKLTLSQIKVIKETFFTVLSGSLHQRIEYPDMKKIDSEFGNKAVEAVTATKEAQTNM